jgi:starch synthase (maltosyl-transferring)
MRYVLAATLSPNYGIYNGFELGENRGIAGTEEYQDSEKYQFKVWDWDRPGNIKDLITRVNRIRRENPALQRLEGVRFLAADEPNILFYAKTNADRSNVLLIAVNLDPFSTHEAGIEMPLDEFGLAEDQNFDMTELLTDRRSTWRGRHHRLRLDPQEIPAQIYLLR